MACGEPTGPSRQILAVVPEQLWLGRNLWHVSRRPPQAMIHGVLEKCFVLGPRGQFVGGSPMGLHLGSSPCSSCLVPAPAALDHPSSQGDQAAYAVAQRGLCASSGCGQGRSMGSSVCPPGRPIGTGAGVERWQKTSSTNLKFAQLITRLHEKPVQVRSFPGAPVSLLAN